MNCPVCFQELSDAGATCPRCGHVGSPWAPPQGAARVVSPPVPLAQGEGVTGGYGDPEQYLSAHPDARVDSYPVVAPPKRRTRLVAVLIGALCIVLIGSGVAVAGGYLGWFGGGKRPSDVLPGSAISYGQLDLDPSLLQKTAAWQFLRDLPEVKAAVGAGLPDPKALLWKLLVKEDDDFATVNYETDVKPWLGNRYGVAALNNDGHAVGVAAVEVTDAELGARTLREWAKKADADYDVTLRDGYALITESKETAFILGEFAKGTLSSNPTFTGDFAALGDPGISAGWADLSGWEKLSGQTVGSAIGVGRGRVALATRFTADTLEVAGITRGFTGAAAIPDGDLGLLPSDTGAAVSITGAGKALADAWPQLPQQAKEAVADQQLSLPDDLVALFGNSFTLAASSDTIKRVLDVSSSSSGTPEIGLRVNSADAGRAEQVLHRLTESSPEAVSTTVDGSVLVAGTTVGYRDRIAGGGDRLSSNEWFAKTVPDHAKATFAAWVDLQAVLGNPQVGSAAGDYTEFVSALRGWGFQFVPGAAGEGAWSVRLVRA
jgi:hypothetical protein